MQQLEPDSPFYNLATTISLRGVLDVAALGWALGALVERHDVLRTAIGQVDGRAVQVVAPAGPLALPVCDLQALPVGRRAPAAERLARFEARRAFDLGHGPLLRAALLRLAPREHRLVLTVHHIAADGWSMGVLLGELGTCYAARRAGRTPDLAPLPVRYGDYAAWQRGPAAAAARAAGVHYWRTQLAGAPADAGPPADRARGATRGGRGASRSFALGAGLTADLRALSRSTGTTLYMTLLAAFGVLLGRYGGQPEVVVGTPVAGRERAELGGLVGCFVNLLALRLDLRGAPGFRTLLGRVRALAGPPTHTRTCPSRRSSRRSRPSATWLARPSSRSSSACSTPRPSRSRRPGWR